MGWYEKLTPTVQAFVKPLLDGIPETKWTLDVVRQVVAWAEEDFDYTWMYMLPPELTEHQRKIQFEFYVCRQRLEMRQRTSYAPEYLAELAGKYGYPEVLAD